ncbi:MAG: hypothetical protein ABMB14_36450 [Myxococcota bacterium]
MLWPLALVSGFAADDPPSRADEPAEEIVVWGDRFQRWERRWYVETEVRFPEPSKQYAWVNQEIELLAVQIRAVLSCDKDFPQGPNQWEVHCDVEDIGLVAMPRLASDGDDALLAELDATLTESAIQLQVSEAGGVPNVDLEQIDVHDDRTRLRAEQLRQLMSRVILPFHLAIPDPVHSGKQWYENQSRLLSMPSSLGSGGGITLAHYLNALGPDWFVVQSIGRATIAPVVGAEVWTGTDVIAQPVDQYALDLHGVALVEQRSGIMTERVWVVSGELTPSSPHALSGGAYYHAGRLQMLGETDHPDVGATWVAARPNGRDPERRAWVPLPQ